MLNWIREFLDKILSVFPRMIIIAPNEMGVLVILGKKKKVLYPGWWFWLPLISEIDYCEVIDQIQPLDEISVTLQSGETVLLQPALRYEIVDIVKAFYEVQDLTETLYTLTKAKMREVVREYESFSDLEMSLNDVLDNTKDQLAVDAVKWGVSIDSVLLVDFGLHKIYRIIGDKTTILEEEE